MRVFITHIFLFVFVFQATAQISDFDQISFEKADEIALKYKDETLHNLPDLVYKLTSELDTDAERFRAIFKWVCSSVSNNYKLYKRNKRQRYRYKDDPAELNAWNSKFQKIVFKKLLKNRSTICTGYAYLVKELANLADIECEMVHGYGRTSTINLKTLDSPNHSWNAVKLNGKWYLCDPTWASGIPNPETYQFQFDFNGGFFLSDPKIFAVNHHPIDKKWFLMEGKTPSLQDFMDAPIIYNKAYTYFSDHSYPQTLYNAVERNKNINFKLQLQKEIEKEDVNLVIESSFRERKIYPKQVSIQDKSLSIDYKFEFTGFYDVHLYIKDDLISTYTIEVTR
ncbi:transglutaminase-like superfamily protein [Kordia sp. SMS9]|uniref:transglutaminase domain-containing protein n=1 Tax=Kordia sp. SMS9 TaxID=2282170 RepID=UPI000E0DFFAF|nr:transglutaminase domain-containing protein [Kordia sp. SMS9]AXG69641.1 transglutaminase-like superfamily protein [Kordia sp. SMS9]